MAKWICSICGHIHTGAAPPENCPICGAPASAFKEKKETAKESGPEADPFPTDADILVIGSGAAGFSAAITARAHGASVILLEKAPATGGTTARSGGGYWIPLNRYQREAGYPDNREDCLQYMARYSYPHLYRADHETLGLPQREYALLAAYCDNAHRAVDFFDETGALHSILEINWTGEAQVDYQNHLPENKNIRGRSIYPRAADGKLGMGTELIRQMEGWARAHDITIVTDCEAHTLLTDPDGRVSGVLARHREQGIHFTAKKAVIFGSGGYSHNAEYMLQFQRGPHFGGCSVPTNTGDFIRMAGQIGARIGNTAGAFRAQSMIETALAEPGGSSNVFYLPGDSMLLVNKYGRRIVDEKRNYTDRAMIHFQWDAQKAEWTNLVTFMLYDHRTATLWQGYPPFPVQGSDGGWPSHILKAETLEELTAEIKNRLQRLSPHTGGFMLDDAFEANLQKTLSTFNHSAATGNDENFRRGEFAYDREWTTFPPTVPGAQWPPPDSPNYTMHTVSPEGPYYAVLLAAGTLDTNGGPVTDENANVLNWQDRPIRGLYGAGNCIASPTANAYWGAGSTIGPALTFGYIAARHALGKGDQSGTAAGG